MVFPLWFQKAACGFSNSYGKKAKIGLNVKFFCRDICSGVKNWLATANENEAIKSRLDRLPQIEISLAHADEQAIPQK